MYRQAISLGTFAFIATTLLLTCSFATAATITETCAARWPSNELNKELCVSNAQIASWERLMPRTVAQLSVLGYVSPESKTYLDSSVHALETDLPEFKSKTAVASTSVEVRQLRGAFDRQHRAAFIISQTTSIAAAERTVAALKRYARALTTVQKERNALSSQGINVSSLDAILSKITPLLDTLRPSSDLNKSKIADLRKSEVQTEQVASLAALREENVIREEIANKMRNELQPLFEQARTELARLSVPPSPPKIENVLGPSATTIGSEETWTIVASDANNDVLSFRVSYTDGTENPVTTAGTFSRSFNTLGTYTITVVATDPGGLQSNVFTKTVQVSASSPVAHGVKMWLTPTFASTDFYKFPFMSPTEGDLLKHVDTFKFYSGRFPVNTTDSNPNAYYLAELKQFAEIFNSRGIQTSFETGLGVRYCEQFPLLIGEKSAERDLKRLQIWHDQGGKTHSITFDGPEFRMLAHTSCVGKGFSVTDVARESADYFVAIKKGFEELGLQVPSFDLISNFPNWPYEGMRPSNWGSNLTIDYKDILKAIVAETGQRGVKIRSLQLDNPMYYGGFDRVKKIAEYSRSIGLQVGMIFNSGATQLITQGTSNCDHNVNYECRGPIIPKTSNDEYQEEKYAQDTIAAINEWKRVVGTLPDYAVIQSWYAHPYSIFPITQKNTMSNLFMQSEKLLNH